jgi:hypothetical protein
MKQAFKEIAMSSAKFDEQGVVTAVIPITAAIVRQ